MWGLDLFGGDRTLEAWFGDGWIILEELQAAVHGDVNPRTLDEEPVRRWQEHGWELELEAVRAGMPGVIHWLAGKPLS